MTAAELYAAMHAYLTDRGWVRINEGEGWWWHGNFDGECLIGEAVDDQLADEGVDVRKSPRSILLDVAADLARGEFEPLSREQTDAAAAGMLREPFEP